ncbi:uncharacterized protein [Haliotis asinina]|uniref:uncharacterized protein n=1 Tax=Haliotis asinina TaxID=109174 RepID=UPI00353241E3
MTNNRHRADHSQVKLSNIFSDTNHDARFESMRRNTRSARVLRRHEDLRKQCEKEVRAYERWQKLAASELRQLQTRYLEKLKRFKKSLSYHPSSQPKGTVSIPVQRVVSSANSVPHYVRSRGSITPENPDRDDPDVDQIDSHRSNFGGEELDSHRSNTGGEQLYSHRSHMGWEQLDSHRSHMDGDQLDSHRSRISGEQLDSHRSHTSGEQQDSHRSQLSVGDPDRHRGHKGMESDRLQTPRDDPKLRSPRNGSRSEGINIANAMESLMMSLSTLPDTPRFSDPRRLPISKTVTFSSPVSTPRSARSPGRLFPNVNDLGQRGRTSKNNTGVKVTAEMVEFIDLRDPKGFTREHGTETFSKGNKKAVTFFV